MSAGPRIYRGLDEVDRGFGPCALSIGNFDGVHAGHRRILRRVCAVAKEHGWKPAALTFHPHPATVVAPQRAPRLLTTPEQRCRIMAQEGIEQVLILPFDWDLARLSPEEFVRDVLMGRLNARAVLVGHNFRFGRGQAGDTDTLAALGAKYGYQTEVVPAVTYRGRAISSSVVRRLLEQGAVALAGRLLERPPCLEGDVIPGHGIGKSTTVPTLNLRPEAGVLPATGVYITRTHDPGDGRTWPSVTNVGFRPTFGGSSLNVETFLLGAFDGNAPRRITVEFLRRLREERKFPDAASLKAQILKDAARAGAYHRRLGRWLRNAGR